MPLERLLIADMDLAGELIPVFLIVLLMNIVYYIYFSNYIIELFSIKARSFLRLLVFIIRVRLKFIWRIFGVGFSKLFIILHLYTDVIRS
jgi:hypothetical protein